MRFHKFRFDNAEGETLAARLDLPVDEEPLAFALFAHCFTCSKDLVAASNISRALTSEGIAVLRFDFTGLGESGGDFASTNFSSNVQDLILAAQHLSERYGEPRLLVGHSLGGAAVLQAAGSLPSVRAVVTIGAPFEPAHVEELLTGSIEEIEREGKAEVQLAGRTFTITKQFLDDLDRFDMEAAIRDLDRALLVMHAPLDDTVGIDNAARIFQAAKHPKSFVTLDDADHLLSEAVDSRYAGHVLAAWARRYVDIPLPEDEAEEGASRRGRVVARLDGAGFRTELRAGRHGLLADEPLSAGGTDLGPTPYDLLLAALGACTAITLRMYARHKEIPLDAITVHLEHSRVHAEDCADCETEKGKIDRIERRVQLEGDLTKAQRERLLQIAERCPVHRTLTTETRIETREEAAPPG